MAVSRGPHVRELFVGQGISSGSGFHYTKKESKTKYSLKSKNQGGNAHHKLGQYKPKILQAEGAVNVPVSKNYVSPADKNSIQKEDINNKKAFIIGDKDIPMVIEPAVADDNIYTEIPGGTVTTPDEGEGLITQNPLFNETSLQNETSLEHNGEVHRSSRVFGSRSHNVSQDTILEEIDGVAIPAPDYDEHEMTIDFTIESEQSGRHEEQGKPVYKEYSGEDLSQYLADDDNETEFDSYTWRTTIPRDRKSILSMEKRAKTEVKRDKRRDSSKMLFKRQDSNTDKGKGTIRHFSVSDTKLGLEIDGSSKKHSKDSMKNGVDYGTTYEAFLKSRNNDGPGRRSLESTSSDSGHETGEDNSRTSVDAHFKEKSPIWKKLTWKLKRQVGLHSVRN